MSLLFVFYFLRTCIFILLSCTSFLLVLCLLLSSKCDSYGWFAEVLHESSKGDTAVRVMGLTADENHTKQLVAEIHQVHLEHEWCKP